MQLIEPDVATVSGHVRIHGPVPAELRHQGQAIPDLACPCADAQQVSGIGGTATDVRINAELIMDMKKTMSEAAAEQTGHTVEEICRDNEYGHWFTAQEALNTVLWISSFPRTTR